MLFDRPDRYLHFGWFPEPEAEVISIQNAPAAMQGLSVLFISDVHLRRQVSDIQLQRLIDLIRIQKADLLLLGGDYAEEADQCRRFFEALSRVDAPMGRFGVLGNNDRECFPEIAGLRGLMEQNGVRLLVNECVQLEGLEIAGCDEYKYGHPDVKDVFSGGSYRILLSHFPIDPGCRADMMLCGHTHGGQFNVMGITPYVFGFEHKYRIEAVSGMQRKDYGALMVSKGIGVSKLPLRIGVKPQIHVVKFTG